MTDNRPHTEILTVPRDPRQAWIIGVQCRCDHGKSRHQPIDSDVVFVSRGQQHGDLTLLTNHEPALAPLDKWCLAQQQAIRGEGETQIVIAIFA